MNCFFVNSIDSNVRVRLPSVGTFSIGRPAAGRAPDLAVDDPCVSREQALVSIVADEVYLTNLGSNPTCVNGAAVQRCRLVDGDRVTVGPEDWIFQRQEDTVSDATIQVSHSLAEDIDRTQAADWSDVVPETQPDPEETGRHELAASVPFGPTVRADMILVDADAPPPSETNPAARRHRRRALGSAVLASALLVLWLGSRTSPHSGTATSAPAATVQASSLQSSAAKVMASVPADSVAAIVAEHDSSAVADPDSANVHRIPAEPPLEVLLEARRLVAAGNDYAMEGRLSLGNMYFAARRWAAAQELVWPYEQAPAEFASLRQRIATAEETVQMRYDAHNQAARSLFLEAKATGSRMRFIEALQHLRVAKQVVPDPADDRHARASQNMARVLREMNKKTYAWNRNNV